MSHFVLQWMIRLIGETYMKFAASCFLFPLRTFTHFTDCACSVGRNEETFCLIVLWPAFTAVRLANPCLLARKAGYTHVVPPGVYAFSFNVVQGCIMQIKPAFTTGLTKPSRNCGCSPPSFMRNDILTKSRRRFRIWAFRHFHARCPENYFICNYLFITLYRQHIMPKFRRLDVHQSKYT